jgi:formiminotetrahydrofolate cyclodeaminase
MSPGFLEKLAQARPDPGGGAAAAYGATLGLALLEKVLQLELKRPQTQNPSLGRWQQNRLKLRQLQKTLKGLQADDVKAYLHLAHVRASGHCGPELTAAVQQALEVPRQIMVQAREGLDLIRGAGALCQKHLLSDLLVAASFLAAALEGAYHIACANLPLIAEASRREALAAALFQTSQDGRGLHLKIKQDFTAREPHLDPRG